MNHLNTQLELTSQVELLDRLQLLSHFGSHLICLNGDNGAGKSWLAESFLEHRAADLNQCLLLCHPQQTSSQHRQTIIQQLLSSDPSSSSASLVELFLHQFSHEPCQALIVIDDAHCLNESLLTELWQLVLEAQQHASWLVNVLLISHEFSTPEHGLNHALARLSYGQESKPFMIDVEPLSKQEADLFLKKYVLHYVKEEQEKQIQREYLQTSRLPGELLALRELKVQRRILIQGFVGSPVKILSTLAVLAVLILFGYWWLFNQQGMPPVNMAPEPTVIASKVVSQAKPAIPAQSVEDKALPPPVIDKTTTLETKPQVAKERVVIKSAVVDALVAQGHEEVEQPNVTQPLQTQIVKTQPVTSTAAPVVNTVAVKPSASAPAHHAQQPISDPVASAHQVKSQRAASPLASESMLMTLPSSDYTLQLAALGSLQDAQTFLVENGLKRNAHIYRSLRQGKTWFIVTYHHYATAKEGRAAKGTLPSSVLKHKPWLKPLHQIQAEITQFQAHDKS